MRKIHVNGYNATVISTFQIILCIGVLSLWAFFMVKELSKKETGAHTESMGNFITDVSFKDGKKEMAFPSHQTVSLSFKWDSTDWQKKELTFQLPQELEADHDFLFNLVDKESRILGIASLNHEKMNLSVQPTKRNAASFNSNGSTGEFILKLKLKEKGEGKKKSLFFHIKGGVETLVLNSEQVQTEKNMVSPSILRAIGETNEEQQRVSWSLWINPKSENYSTLEIAIRQPLLAELFTNRKNEIKVYEKRDGNWRNINKESDIFSRLDFLVVSLKDSTVPYLIEWSTPLKNKQTTNLEASLSRNGKSIGWIMEESDYSNYGESILD